MTRSARLIFAMASLGVAGLVLAPAPALSAASPLRVEGVATTDGGGGAWTYNATELPSGSRIAVNVTYPDDGTTIVSLHISGAQPHREYGAHAHKAACTTNSADALGHFQFVPNPNPLNPTDPTYANATNEVWLDVHTNGSGNGRSKAVVPWQPGQARPMSVVIHEAHTSTEPGSAGTAGLRLGCLTVPF